MHSMNYYGLDISEFRGDNAFDYVGERFLLAVSAKRVPLKMLNNSMQFEVAFYCRRGSLRIDFEDSSYFLNADQLFVYADGRVIHNAEASPDADIVIMGCTWDVVEESETEGHSVWSLVDYVAKAPMVAMKEEYQPWFKVYLQRLEEVCRSSEPFLKSELIITFLRLFLYEFVRMIGDKLNAASKTQSRSCKITQSFFNVLASGDGRVRSIAEIAATLGMTSKYLSRIVKETTGDSALSFVQRYTMRAIRRKLKCTNWSFKEIAYRQGFPSLTAFGKYVKAQTGMSPSEYRKKLRRVPTVPSLGGRR